MQGGGAVTTPFAALPADPRAAATILAQSFPIFPCGQNKAPLTKHGFKDASQDAALIDRWWDARPQAQIGMPTGAASNILVIDIDIKGDEEPDDILAALQMEYEDFVSAPIVATPSGGRHVYFQHDPRIRINGSGKTWKPQVDWRGEGGYVIVPPSAGYTLIRDGEIAAAPPAMIAAIIAAQGGPVLEVAGGTYSLQYQKTLKEIAEQIRANKDWHANTNLLIARWTSAYGVPPDEWINLAPFLQQPGYSLEQTIREIHTSAQGAFKKYAPEPPTEIPSSTFGATPFDWNAAWDVRPRDWVYHNFIIRRFASLVGAPGGTGKTAYLTSIALAVITGQALLEEKVHSPGGVWIYNLEDPLEEVQRRVIAAAILHKLKRPDIEGKLFVDSGRDQALCIAERSRDTLIVTPHVQAMTDEIGRRGIALLIVDPFIKSHRLDENKNGEVDFAATQWAKIAHDANCAIVLAQHFRKGGSSGDADAFRGASALIDASRAAVSLAAMKAEEAERFGVEPELSRRLFRTDNAKLNMAPRPEEASWFELRSVEIPSGDHVQAVLPWAPEWHFHGLSVAHCNQILDRLSSGYDADDMWSPAKQSGSRWAGISILAACGDIGVEKTEAHATAILAEWVKNGVIEIIEYKRPNRVSAKGVKVKRRLAVGDV